MEIYRDLDTLPNFSKQSVLTIGSFDGVHHGHQKLLQQLNTLANQISGVSVVITFHPHPRQIIYPKDQSLKLLTSLNEKIRLIEAQGIDHLIIVPFTVEFSQLHPREYVENFLIKRFNPRFIIIGYDHRFGLNREGNIDLLKSYESPRKLEIIELDKQSVEAIVVSSTKIRNALLGGEMGLANKLLNYNYLVSGKVVHGEKVGSSLGYPTANIELNEAQKLIPKAGIYTASISFDNSCFDGMLYIGERPVIHNDDSLRIEMHIFDFDDILYDKAVIVRIGELIREDQNFDSLDDMKVQMKLDEKKARSYFDTKNQSQNLKKTDTVAIAILNYNGIDYLRKFLPTIINNTPPYASVYVIDNGSNDGSVEMLQSKFDNINIVALNQNYGFAGGYNEGLKQIEATYYYLINSDIEVRQDWIDPIYKFCKDDPSIAACQPKILSYHEPTKFEYAGGAGGLIDLTYYPFCMGRILNEIEEDLGKYDQPSEIFWASGAALFIQSKVFDSFEGFDSSYFAHQEEIDLCWRFKRAGYKVLSCPDAKVYHVGGGTLTYESPRKTFLNFRNNLFTIFKNLKVIHFVLLFPIRLILDMAASLNYLIGGHFKNALQVFKAYGTFFINLGKLVKTKKINNRLIEANRISDSNHNSGLYKGSILIDYYLKGKKTFLSLNPSLTGVFYERTN